MKKITKTVAILLFLPLFFLFSQICSAAIPPDGTVILWVNGRHADNIQHYTQSNKTHACIVLYEGEKAFVYESSNPQVKRYTWEQYVSVYQAAQKEFINLRFLFFEPGNLTKNQLNKMKEYANKQLGRPFGVASFLSGRPRRTIHCGEYVGNILERTGQFRSFGPRETPETLYQKLKKE